MDHDHRSTGIVRDLFESRRHLVIVLISAFTGGFPRLDLAQRIENDQRFFSGVEGHELSHETSSVFRLHPVNKRNRLGKVIALKGACAALHPLRSILQCDIEKGPMLKGYCTEDRLAMSHRLRGDN